MYNNESCPQEIQNVANNLYDSNSLFINQKELLVILKAIYPIDKMGIGYQAFNTLNISLTGASPYVHSDVFLVSKMPVLSMDTAPSTTDSAGWWVKPTRDLENYILTQNPLGFNLWENGSMTPTATVGANVNYIFSEKPTAETISSVYKMIKLVLKYLDVSKIYISGDRAFLSQPDQPDIIIGIPFNEGSLSSALQSTNYLVTIKKDAKVIDLSFRNPIIR